MSTDMVIPKVVVRVKEHGRVLKAARVRKGYTQRDVHKFTGIPISTLKDYEQGLYMPRADREIQLMNLLEIDLADLAGVSIPVITVREAVS